MSQETAAPPRRPSVLLIVSLCMNIILIPVIATVVVRALHRDSVVGAGGILAPRSVMAAIPNESERIQAIINGHASKVMELRSASVQARRQAFTTLAASDFSQASFVRSLAAVADADAALERENVAMMAQSLAALTPEERRTLVARTKAKSRSWFWRTFRPHPRRF